MTQINCSKRHPKAANKIKKEKGEKKKKSTPQQAPYRSQHPSLRIPAPAARKALPVSGMRVRAEGQAVPWAHTAALVPRSPRGLGAARRPRRTRAACSEHPRSRRRPRGGQQDRMLPQDPTALGGCRSALPPVLGAECFKGQSCFNVTQVLLAQGIASRWPLHHPFLSRAAFLPEPADISFPKPLIPRPSGSVWLSPGGSRGCHSAACYLLHRLRGSRTAPAFPTAMATVTATPPDPPVLGGRKPSAGMSVPKDAPVRTGSSQPQAQLATADSPAVGP